MDDSAKCRYDIILGRYLLPAFGLNLEWYEHAIEAYYGTFKVSMAPMVYLVTDVFKIWNTGMITPGESFMNTYAEYINES